MDYSIQLFSNSIENNLSQKIIDNIQNGQWTEILNNLCYIKENTIILDYIYFKHFAHKNTYDIILNYIVHNIDHLLSKYKNFDMHVNLKNFTVIDIDKHKTFIQNAAEHLKDRYPEKLAKCYIYNAPFIFSQFYNIINLFIDKNTQKKIQLVSPK